MSAQNFIQYIRTMATNAIETETDKRARLAAHLTSDKVVDALSFETVMTAAAEAKPWRTVLRIADTKTMAEAITEVREAATRQLIEHGESQSTSALRNEEDRMVREGLRRFLGRTSNFAEQIAAYEQADQEAAAEQAEQPTAETKAPEQQPTRKPSPAQARVLAVIATDTVALKRTGSSSHSPIRAFGPNGAMNTRVVETCVSHGWAVLDSAATYYQGKPVTLTDAGRAALPTA
ncbi:hypothetical protein [[Kitasatospora] papulosa]|uniref:hypothetical protein n=1 Tax=[Kitasatospora] papulosa TaxID=1464011 RepID=UPI00367E4A53